MAGLSKHFEEKASLDSLASSEGSDDINAMDLLVSVTPFMG